MFDSGRESYFRGVAKCSNVCPLKKSIKRFLQIICKIRWCQKCKSGRSIATDKIHLSLVELLSYERQLASNRPTKTVWAQCAHIQLQGGVPQWVRDPVVGATKWMNSIKMLCHKENELYQKVLPQREWTLSKSIATKRMNSIKSLSHNGRLISFHLFCQLSTRYPNLRAKSNAIKQRLKKNNRNIFGNWRISLGRLVHWPNGRSRATKESSFCKLLLGCWRGAAEPSAVQNN